MSGQLGHRSVSPKMRRWRVCAARLTTSQVTSSTASIHAHGVVCRPPIAEVVETTFVPTPSLKPTSRDMGRAGIGDQLRRCPAGHLVVTVGVGGHH